VQNYNITPPRRSTQTAKTDALHHWAAAASPLPTTAELRRGPHF